MSDLSSVPVASLARNVKKGIESVNTRKTIIMSQTVWFPIGMNLF